MTDSELIEAVLAWRKRRHQISATTFTVENADTARREASRDLYKAVNEYASERESDGSMASNNE